MKPPSDSKKTNPIKPNSPAPKLRRLLITLALVTAMRKSELLNLTWGDIDFEEHTVLVSPKQDADETWEWKIKDTDCRVLPLTEDTVHLLVNLQNRRQNCCKSVAAGTLEVQAERLPNVSV